MNDVPGDPTEARLAESLGKLQGVPSFYLLLVRLFGSLRAELLPVGLEDPALGAETKRSAEWTPLVFRDELLQPTNANVLSVLLEVVAVLHRWM